MTDAEILRGLTEVFRDVFDDSTIELRPEMSGADIPEWTSFNHINLLVASEQKFGVKFSTADIEKLKNVGDLVALIQTALTKKR